MTEERWLRTLHLLLNTFVATAFVVTFVAMSSDSFVNSSVTVKTAESVGFKTGESAVVVMVRLLMITLRVKKAAVVRTITVEPTV